MWEHNYQYMWEGAKYGAPKREFDIQHHFQPDILGIPTDRFEDDTLHERWVTWEDPESWNRGFQCGYPTDCDGLIEYRNRAYVLFEIKGKDKVLPDGQKRAFVRMCDDFGRLQKPAVFIIAEHDVDNPDHDIDAAACRVRAFYFRGRWYRGSDTIKNLIDRFISFVDRRN